jgi:hypothetical protein
MAEAHGDSEVRQDKINKEINKYRMNMLMQQDAKCNIMLFSYHLFFLLNYSHKDSAEVDA